MEGQLQPGVVLLGKLRVVRLLGAGGLGAVYEVEHELTKHRRALKLLHPKHRENREVVQRFLREASAAGHIGDPHIVETFDAGELPTGEPFLLMEMLEGQPLANLFRDAGRLAVSLACDLVGQAANAVDAAHRAGIVHRDLKPENLFVTWRHGKPFIKVLDFGISKFDSERTGAMTVTSAGAAMGTPLYMAPEQMRGAHDVDARADVYALGVVLYEALTGGVPYFAENFAELAALVLGGRAKPLRELRPGVPQLLADVVHRALQVKPADRQPTAADLATALQLFLTFEEPVERGAPPAEPQRQSLLATPNPVGELKASDPSLDSTLPRVQSAPDGAPTPVAAVEVPPEALRSQQPVVASETRPAPPTGVETRAPAPPLPVTPAPPPSSKALPALLVGVAVIVGGLVVRALGPASRAAEVVDAGVVPVVVPLARDAGLVEQADAGAVVAPTDSGVAEDAGSSPDAGAALVEDAGPSPDAGARKPARRPKRPSGLEEDFNAGTKR